MVSLDVGSVESKLRQLKLIGVGAEAEVRLGSYAGIKAVFKYRPPKRYRHKLLDFNLRFARTRREARLLLKASENHIPVPDLLAVYPTLALLVMEYVEGELLRVKLRREPLERGDLLVDAGRILASLHSIGIVHGDSTTSNYIVTPDGRLYIIDFGLSSASQSLEERAVDVHLFRRSLESAHASIADEAFREFTEGYLSVAGEWGERVLRRADEIRLMGRYVAERRTLWRVAEG